MLFCLVVAFKAGPVHLLAISCSTSFCMEVLQLLCWGTLGAVETFFACSSCATLHDLPTQHY